MSEEERDSVEPEPESEAEEEPTSVEPEVEAEEEPTQAEPEAERADADEEEVVPATSAEVAAAGEEFVTGVLRSMELEGEVTSSSDDETAYIDVVGEDLGILIGRRGQTLDALQEITRTAVQRHLRSRARLLVDVEGYRARRRQSLIDYATSIAERAKERGTEIELEPMSAYERKIVHDAVAGIEGASSFSEGEEPNRKVVVRAD
jgi:spoIIIJ-associated protein